MQLTDNKTQELQTFINSIYSQDLSNDLLAGQSERICRVMDSHYFATILFSNRYSVDNYAFSNNPVDFNEVYFQLQHKDALMQRMISENAPVLYNDLNKLDLSESREFFGELNPLRPVSDCCYFPMYLNGRLCGFNGIARADANNRVFDKEDLELFQYISGFINESFIRSMSSEAVDDCEATLDADGNVLQAGKGIEEYFRFVFGDRHWDNPCEGNSYYSLLFTQHLRGFLDPLSANGRGYLSLPVMDYQGTLEFKRISYPEYRAGFRDQPQVVISIKTFIDKTQKKGILDWQLLHERFGLSSFDADIVDCIYRGLSDRDISLFLRISETDLQGRMKDIFTRIGVDSRSSLILSLL